MVNNYLKIAVRNLIRHKGYSFINIFGLSVGLATMIFIFLWVMDELSYDRFHKNGDRAFRVLRNITFTDGSIFTRISLPEPLAQVMKDEVPEVEHTLRLTFGEQQLVGFGEKAFFEEGFFGDPTIFKMFTFPIISGDEANPLPDIKSIAISERLARKYFEGIDPIGQILKVDRRHDFAVTAVFADVPRNSELQFDYILPFEVWRKENLWTEDWGNTGMQMFASLKPGADPDEANKKIGEIIKTHCDDCPSTAFLFPHTKLRLYAEFKDGKNAGGRIEYVISFSLVGLIILVIACINFMNLATARAATRSREVGVRKVIGAQRMGLITQFISEALLMSSIALVFALGMVQLLLPYFNLMTDKTVRLNLSNPLLFTGLLTITVLCGLMAGSYPALFLSSFKPVSALRAPTRSLFSSGGLRKVLVVVQFVASVVLIIGSIVVYDQIIFIRTKHLGFDKENVIIMNQYKGFSENQEVFKNELMQHSSIKSVGIAGQNPFNIQHNTTDPIWPGKPDGANIVFKVIPCDQGFIRALGMTILGGRNFISLQDTVNFLVNEQAVEVMGFTTETIIGTELKMWGRQGKIIGLVRDFNNANLREKIAPLILFYDPQRTWRVYVKVEGNLHDATEHMKKVHMKFNPGYPFEYSILDEEFNKEYSSEEVAAKLSFFFTVIAILLSCLGLLGLASFTAERRIKELGIRKVMGASVVNLMMLLATDFAKLVAIGLIIGCPVAWYVAIEYLSGYAFHAPLNGWVFVVTAAGILLIALLTVLYQSARAAMANPVNSLRNE